MPIHIACNNLYEGYHHRYSEAQTFGYGFPYCGTFMECIEMQAMVFRCSMPSYCVAGQRAGLLAILYSFLGGASVISKVSMFDKSLPNPCRPRAVKGALVVSVSCQNDFQVKYMQLKVTALTAERRCYGATPQRAQCLFGPRKIGLISVVVAYCAAAVICCQNLTTTLPQSPSSSLLHRLTSRTYLHQTLLLSEDTLLLLQSPTDTP